MTPPTPCFIPRTPYPPPLQGVRARTLTSLREFLKSKCPETRKIFSDLSLGSWRHNQVAVEFFSQLGIPVPEPDARYKMDPGKFRNVGEFAKKSAGVWIDVEGEGDRAIHRSLRLATALVGSLSEDPDTVFLVLVPRFGFPWGEENLSFVKFLAQGLLRRKARLFLVHSEERDPVLPTDWTVQWENTSGKSSGTFSGEIFDLIPGVVDPEVTGLFFGTGEDPGRAGLFPLSNGNWLVPSEFRSDPAGYPVAKFDELAERSRSVGWLSAYAQFHGTPQNGDAEFLLQEGWRQFVEGGYHVAFRLLEKAADSAQNPVYRAFCRFNSQKMRLLIHRFREMTELPDPSPDLPEGLRGVLHLSKAWGFVMSGMAERAEPQFQEASRLLVPLISLRELIYLLNIYALNRFRLGDWDGAMEIERNIEALLSRGTPRDWHLEYINALNIARLLRRAKDLDQSEKYYQKGFEATDGAKTESDGVYTNVCWARMDEDRGRKDGAFFNWFRAGLHWVSCSTPEALGWRVQEAIVGRKELGPDEMPETISRSLAESLEKSAREIGLMPDGDKSEEGDAQAPVFLRTDQIPDEAFPHLAELALGGPGWGLFLGSSPLEPPYDGPHLRRLRKLVWRLIGLLTPSGLPNGIHCVWVDDCFGTEVPLDLTGLAFLSALKGVSQVQYRGKRITLGPEQVALLLRKSRVALGNGVDTVETREEGMEVRFKRYLPRRILSQRETEVVRHLRDPVTLEELERMTGETHSREELWRLLLSLQKSRIVRLTVSDADCGRVLAETPFSQITDR